MITYINYYLYTFIGTLLNQYLIIVENNVTTQTINQTVTLRQKISNLYTNIDKYLSYKKYFTFLQSTHTINLVKAFFFQVKSWYRQLTTYLYPLQVHVYEKLIHRKLSEILLKIDSCTLIIPIKTTKFQNIDKT